MEDLTPDLFQSDVVRSRAMRRRLERNEREVLLKMLSEPFLGAPELRAQVEHVFGVGGTSPTWLGFEVDPVVERSPCTQSRVPGNAWVFDDKGETIGMVLVWVDDGWLSALEYGWVTDEAPTTFPAAHAVRFLEPTRVVQDARPNSTWLDRLFSPRNR